MEKKKLTCSEQVRGELEKQMELLRQVLEDKEKEIRDTKDQLRQAKEEAICEYCGSDAFLAELGGSFAEGFDDALHQVKASYPDLDVSHINIDAQAQTSVQPSTPRAQTSCLLMMPLSTTLMVTKGLLLKAKPKSSRSTPVNLKIKFWKMMTLPFNSRFFFFFWFCNGFGEQL